MLNRTTVYVSGLALAVGLALGTAPAPVLAAADCGEKREVTASGMDEATYKRMTKAYELVGEEQYQEAQEIFVQLRGRANTDYMKATLAQAIAQVNWALEDYDGALREFELAVELDSLPDRAHYALMYQIAQLYYSKNRYDDALDRLDLWFCKVPVDQHKATAYVLQGSIHAQKEDWPKVIESMNTAIEMDDDPQQNWFQLKLAAHFQLEQYNEAADTLEVMVTRWPDKKTYWTQLSNTYYKLEDDEKALSVMALAYRKGLLDKKENLMYLANLYAMRDVPYKAAQVMQKGLEDGIIDAEERYWTMTGDNWYAAEEYEEALVAFEQAGSLADEGKIDLRRGFILVDMERWEEAKSALSDALEKGGLNDRQTGEAWLLLGMTEYSMGKYDSAATAFTRASRFPDARQQAQQWQAVMRDEQARLAAGP